MNSNQREVLNMTKKQLKKSIETINAEFGNNFAQNHPEVLGAFLIALSNNNLAESLHLELNNITKIIEKHT